VLESAEALVAEHAALERQMAEPAVASDPDRAREVAKRYAALGPTVAAHHAWVRAVGDLAAARELALEDPSFAEELPGLEATAAQAEDRLRRLLIPRDPDDDRDVILEVKAGEGGEESALFAGDLLRMYLRHAERRGWRTEILDATESDLGGYKDVRVSVKARGTAEPGSAPWARLKYEGGVHRVQRVPVTESQGRIHTSAAGVWVMPEAEEVEVSIDPSDLRIDVFRSSGPGGQSVNTTDSAVRITHVPTGLVVSCQNEKSQLQNREAAMRVLRSRLHQMAMEERHAADADARASQVRTVDRSERIRTYNFPENRISDHRTGFKAHNLDAVLDGDLDPVIQSCVDADEAARLAALAAR
jgi:peptide chain release factor 1